jgi:transcription initiation factor TFIIE subunit alpha
VYTISESVQGPKIAVEEKKEYFCPRCKAEWTAMEVLDNADESGFLCHRCGFLLQYQAERNAGGHEKSTRLNHQFKFISELLPKIDSVRIPKCDFDRALAVARPVEREATHQRAATIAVDPSAGRPMAVKGLANSGPQSIAVNISAGDGPSEAEKEAERARKEQIAKQNALPAWMSQSTVTGESFSGAGDSGIASKATALKEENKDQNGSGIIDSNASAQIDDIFEKLKAEQAAERLREMEEEEDSGSEEEDDDEEAEFENVKELEAESDKRDTATPSIKREKSEAVSQEDSSEERQAKRVKVEPDVKKESSDEDEDDEDELEFEDV